MFSAAMGLIGSAAIASSASAAPAVSGEFALPAGQTLAGDNEIVEGPDGNMWVTTETNSVVRIRPNGAMTPFPLGADAYGITVGPDDNLWASQSIGVVKIDPATGTATPTAIGGGYANGRGITTGPDGNLWIIGTNTLTRIDPANPAVGQDVNAITTANPKGMTTATDGLLWFADGDKIVSATATDTPTRTSYVVGGGSQDVAAGPNGQVAYANPLDTPHEVGLISPGGTPQQISIEISDPFGVAFGADGAYWVARSSTDDLLRLAPDGTTTKLTGFSNAANVGPRKIAAGPNNTLWVTLDDQEKVARVTGVEPPASGGGGGAGTAGETTIDKGPKRKIKTRRKRAKVRFRFSSSDPTATFECALKRPRKRAGKAPAAFIQCSSPRKYKLKPGKYTFKVRATVGGVTDETPAQQKFKVVRVSE
jgi:streptogramin lyase